MPETPSTTIQPRTPVSVLDRARYLDTDRTFAIAEVAPLVGMQATFIKRVVGNDRELSVADVILLLDQDAFAETFVPRSKVLEYLMRDRDDAVARDYESPERYDLVHEDCLSFIRRVPDEAVNCIVTSTPYWAMRVYKESRPIAWADGDLAPYGHEQTPEGFVRHTTEILHALSRVLTQDGSIWWNVMDTFNTRTQIRGSAVEALRAMQGGDHYKVWSEHEYRRYSAGHSYLKDGEQVGIPAMIAQRASRLGLFVKGTITWAKTATLPEPQKSRVSRQLEYVIHITKQRTPKFDKDAYSRLSTTMGGRNQLLETAKLSDVWVIPTSSGGDGHGAQFPLALPARCIGLSTDPGDIVLDPFVGSGTSVVAALALGRRGIGTDTAREYLAVAESKVQSLRAPKKRGAQLVEASLPEVQAV
ncbi:site-specific DNA-methyltransferase [Curtobacterium flaccumfaciens pv. beticola]|uniref:DNA-methyltransferase n=1 Tax=Curtobacterium flaccumfaciens TaxID=2035 RepID=UPI00349F3399|nr:site-specific DNA-methyltransferase [Curtobacterium flaccumfaciens pv. basellae]